MLAPQLSLPTLNQEQQWSSYLITGMLPYMEGKHLIPAHYTAETHTSKCSSLQIKAVN